MKSTMYCCGLCKTDVTVERNAELIIVNHVKVMEFGNVIETRCIPCNKCVVVEVKGKLLTPEQLLLDESGKDGWSQVDTPREWLALYILIEVVHKEEREQFVRFSMPEPLDVAFLCWEKGRAVGFYTVKPLGTGANELNDGYCMNTLDTCFIRESHRRHGYGLSLLRDLTKRYPGEDVAFSKPISSAMYAVLRKHLKENPDLRYKFWEVAGFGYQGDRILIWYNLKIR